MKPPSFTIIEISGHIIDSLTLAKVIDLIQGANCPYQINDLQIGQKKNDFSYAQISVWAEDQQTLKALLTELRSYGAHSLEDGAAAVEVIEEDGQAPHNAYTRPIPPTEVLYHGKWMPVSRQGLDLVVIIDTATQQARFEKVGNVKKGDMIVVGQQGVKILPSLSESANAQPVAR